MTGIAKRIGGTEYATPQRLALNDRRVNYFENGCGNSIEKLGSLMRFMTRQDLAKLLTYNNIFQKTQGVTGSIVECGVFFGNSLLTWAKLAAAFEPHNYTCKVIGFDTFEGSTGYSEKDNSEYAAGYQKTQTEKAYFADSYEDLKEAIEIYDMDRAIAHIPKIELVKGDVRETSHAYLQANPHLMIRVLSLTVNLYEPIKIPFELFIPRLTKGSIICIDTLNSTMYPGPTQALLDVKPLSDLAWKTPPEFPNINYAMIE